jgi:hypothetical protein
VKAILYLATPWFLLVASCVSTDSLARQRASNEFRCAEDRVVLTRRRDLSEGTFDADACGHHARYTCVITQREHVCTREPL